MLINYDLAQFDQYLTTWGSRHGYVVPGSEVLGVTTGGPLLISFDLNLHLEGYDDTIKYGCYPVIDGRPAAVYSYFQPPSSNTLQSGAGMAPPPADPWYMEDSSAAFIPIDLMPGGENTAAIISDYLTATTRDNRVGTLPPLPDGLSYLHSVPTHLHRVRVYTNIPAGKHNFALKCDYEGERILRVNAYGPVLSSVNYLAIATDWANSFSAIEMK